MTDASLDIVLVSPGMPHDGNTLRQRSLGGSETAAVNIAKALAARGHAVTVFSPCEQPVTVDGVQWLPLQMAQAYLTATAVDVCVISRDLQSATLPMNVGCKALWCHDLSLKRSRPQFSSALWNLDAVFVLSAFQRRQYQEMHGIAGPILVQTRNGIDLTRFRPIPLPFEKRDPWKLVYGSRPERGLEVLCHVMRLAAQRGLKWKLQVSTYDNPIPQLGEMYQALFDQCRGVGNITISRPLTQAEWTRELSTAKAMVYPGVQNDFREISPVHGDTLIETLRGPKRIRDLEGQSGFHVYSCNTDGKLSVSKVNGVFRTRRDARVIRLVLRPHRGRNAKKEIELTLTPDHEVMLLDGTYKAAGLLKRKDRVKAFHRNLAGDYPYDRIGLTGEKIRDGQRVVAEWKYGRPLNRREVAHHIDGNGMNNEPDNLELTSQSNHRKRHWAEASPEWRQAWGEEFGERVRRERDSDPRAFSASRAERGLRGGKTRGAQIRAAALSNHVVVAVEEAGNADVFCMEVEPDHNFIANHIVVHNCLAAMEAQACGTPVIAAAKGALPETLHPSAGILLGDDATNVNDPRYHEQVLAAIERLHDAEAWRAMSAAGRAHAETLGWDGVAEQWEGEFRKFIARRSDERWRVLTHLKRNGDHEAAEGA